jgi:hypothetical protein
LNDGASARDALSAIDDRERRRARRSIGAAHCEGRRRGAPIT